LVEVAHEAFVGGCTAEQGYQRERC
jgi:hypothetical protein